jgi:GNAT superfamily N-acetyltransferase
LIASFTSVSSGRVGVHVGDDAVTRPYCDSTAMTGFTGGSRMDTAAVWRIVTLPITHPDAQLLVEEVQAEYVVRYGGRDETPLEPGYFDPPHGGFFVGYVGGLPVASGAWRRRRDVTAHGSDDTAEIKRMYVAPQVRGRGLARLMLAHLEKTAHAAGAEVMVLETGMAQPEAIALYESSGYDAIPGFGFYKDAPLSRCMARSLVTPRPAAGRATT